MGPMQPWRRLEMLEGMQEREGQETGWPDLPRALGGRGRVEDSRE